MSKEAFGQWAVAHGWTADRFGHYNKGEYRFKVQAKSVRLEHAYRTPDSEYQKGEKRYVRLRSAFLSALSVQDGKLAGMKM